MRCYKPSLVAALFLTCATSLAQVSVPTPAQGYVVEHFVRGVGAATAVRYRNIGLEQYLPHGLYVADYEGGAVLRVIEGTGGTRSLIRIWSGIPYITGMAFGDEDCWTPSPCRPGYIFGASGGLGSVYQFRPGEGIAAEWSGFAAPTSLMTRSADSFELYVSESGAGQIAKLDLDAQAASVELGGLSVPNGPYGLARDNYGRLTFADHATGAFYRYDFSSPPQQLGTVTPYGATFTGIAFGMPAVTDVERGELLVLSDGALRPLATGFAGKRYPPHIGPNGFAFVRWFDEPDNRSSLYVGDGDSIWRIRSTDSTPPVVSDVRMEPNPRAVGEPWVIVATIDDSNTGGSVIDGLCPTGLIQEPSPSSLVVLCEGNSLGTPLRLSGGNMLDEPREELRIDGQDVGWASNEPGVYRILFGGYDAAGNLAWDPTGRSSLAFVYDPRAGSFKARGWVNSPLGSVVDSSSVTARANFSAEARYGTGMSRPSGYIDVQVKPGGISCRANQLEWLIVRGGTGMLRGYGPGCQVTLSTIDGNVTGGDGIDRARIQISNGASVIYDSEPGAAEFSSASTALGGGSLAITPTRPSK